MRNAVHGRKWSGLATDQLAAASRLFSSSVVREMARKGRSPLFARLAAQSQLLGSISRSERVYALFDAAFALLKHVGYRHEYIYKAALTHKILLGKHSLQTASMINEFRVGDCKADVAILNGTATVYEVKSERDSLVRLDRQIAAYSTVFAKVYVIAAESHLDAVLSTVPDAVGILCLNKRHQISTVRDAVDQPERTSPGAIFDSIRTGEARMILSSLGISIPHVPNTELHRVLRHAFVRLDPIQAHEGMVRVLKQTRNLLPLSALVDRLPLSLQTAALSVPLRKADHERLVAAVNTRLKDAVGWV
ncbi:MAG: sce7726 family protein [Acidobacteriaceae bacterium]